MAKTIFCIGNGESRTPVDLIKLKPQGKMYGCNGLYRDFIPDVNWVNQWKELMLENPKIKFIKVNPKGIEGSDPVNCVVPEWTVKNIEYINFNEFNKKFNCVSGLTDSQ